MNMCRRTPLWVDYVMIKVSRQVEEEESQYASRFLTISKVFLCFRTKGACPDLFFDHPTYPNVF